MEKEEEGGGHTKNRRKRTISMRRISQNWGRGGGWASSRASYTAIFFLEKRDPPSHAPSAVRSTSTSRD